MPIVSLNGREAVRIRKANEYAAWGSRNEENRVEPITHPAFEVPFQLTPGETIFTIGSCFARHVERELVDRGFRIPMRELFQKRLFKDLPTEIVNNFGTPSIYNEFAWAFGEKKYDKTANIVEVSTDKFVDLHMINSIRPAPLKLVLSRRKGLIKATRALANCRVMIMTLGLVELWWDNQTQTYLNTSPLPSILKRWPERFDLHVLSFEECHDYLSRALDIVFKNGRKDLSVILTVSPVPMMATHRNVDVITANCYSKSVLRSVAEHLVVGDDRISYFPSYETVSMSDRGFAWSDDFVHVNDKMVALNVERMVNAFTGDERRTSDILADLTLEQNETAETLLLAEKARLARMEGNAAFFEDQSKSALTSPVFVLEYAKFLFDTQSYDELLQISENVDGVEIATVRARALIATGKSEEARELIRPICHATSKGTVHWHTYIDATLGMRSLPALLEAEAEWLEEQPRSKVLTQIYVGRALRKMGQHEEAVSRLAGAVVQPDRSDAIVIDYAESLVVLHRHQEAGEILNGVTGNTDWQILRANRLRNQISEALN